MKWIWLSSGALAIVLASWQLTSSTQPGRRVDSAVRNAIPEAPTAAASKTKASVVARRSSVRPEVVPDGLSHFLEKLRDWKDYSPSPELAEEMLALLSAENAADIMAALSYAQLDSVFGNSLFERWVDLAPEAAADWLSTSPQSVGPQTTLVARKFLGDPEAFGKYCEQLPDTPWKQRLLNAAGAEAAEQNPALAMALAKQLSPGAEQAGLIEIAAYHWGRSDAEAAAQQIAQEPSAELRDQLTAAAAKGLSEVDPVEAANWIISGVESETLLGESAICIADIWAKTDPAATAAWVSRFPEGPTRDQVTVNLLNHWLTTDYQAAASWAADISNPTLRRQLESMVAQRKPPGS